MPFTAGEWAEVARIQRETRAARAANARARTLRRRVGQLGLAGVADDVEEPPPPAAQRSPLVRVGTCAHCPDRIYRQFTHTPPADRFGRRRPRYVLNLCERHYHQATGLAYGPAERLREWRLQRELEERKAEEARIADEPPK